MSKQSTISFTALLVALAMSGPVSINFYLPELPDIATRLATDPTKVQQTVSAYLIGFALAQLLLGPLSDRFGRRPVLLVSYLFFSMASLLCAKAESIELLIIARFLQSLGGCAGVLISRAVIRGLYTAQDVGRMMSYLGSGFAIAPMISPVLGGLLGECFMFSIFHCGLIHAYRCYNQ
jgi:DHA1 family bicyclomycin/chloramphenicol resistance-like MFS transporter